MASKFIQNSLEHHILELGSFTSFFSLPYDSHQPTWLTVLWEFVGEHDIILSNSSNVRLYSCDYMTALLRKRRAGYKNTLLTILVHWTSVLDENHQKERENVLSLKLFCRHTL